MNVVIPDFKPCWWLKNPHLQTIVASYIKPQKVQGRSERLELSDGDFIDIIWYQLDREPRPIVLLLHGLEGSEDSHYIRSAVRAMTAAGFVVVFMFHRGCSAEHNRLDRSYHSGETGDMAEVMNYIESRTGRNIFAAVGYSLGANALLKYLGEKGDYAKVSRAVAVSVPFNLYAASLKLNKGLSRIYQRYLIAKMVQRYQSKFMHRPEPVNCEISTLKTFFKFDEKITSTINGFSGAREYYDRSSSNTYLSGIRKPCLILHAKDDPFLPASAIPDRHNLPENIHLELLSHGGHVGFLEGKYLPRPWLDKAILSFLK